MSLTLKAVALAVGLAVASPVSAKPLSVVIEMASFNGPPAYLAAYITDPSGGYVSTVYVAGQRERFQADMRTWNRMLRKSGKAIDGTTGASVGRGGRISTSFEVPDALLNAGYTLHVETAVEDYGSVADDAVVPLSDANNGVAVAGKGNVGTATVSY